jgi:hypothetical protein
MTAMEALVRRYSTCVVDGQRLRLHMTRMEHPEHARIGLLGFNQATPFLADRVSPDDYVAAMLHGPTGRALNKKLRDERGPSPTRQIIDSVSDKLGGNVLELNAICYSTPTRRDLTEKNHPGGRAAGRKASLAVLSAVPLPVLIVHGSGAARELGRTLRASLPDPASKPADGVSCCQIQTELLGRTYEPFVVVIRSLSPRAWHHWKDWAPQHSDKIVDTVQRFLT